MPHVSHGSARVMVARARGALSAPATATRIVDMTFGAMMRAGTANAGLAQTVGTTVMETMTVETVVIAVTLVDETTVKDMTTVMARTAATIVILVTGETPRTAAVIATAVAVTTIEMIVVQEVLAHVPAR